MKNLKQIFFCFLLLFCTYNLTAGNDLKESLYDREKLIQQYDSLKAQITDSTFFNIRNIALIQAKLIQIDSYIINDFEYISDKYDNLIISNDKLKVQFADNKNELKEKSKWIEWGMYGSGILFLLFLVIFILFILKSIKTGKLKRRIKELEKLHEQYQERLELSKESEINKAKLLEVEASYNRVIKENNEKFENEKNSISEKLFEAQQILESLKNVKSSLQQENATLLAQIENGNTENEKNEMLKILKETADIKEQENIQLKETMTLLQQQNKTLDFDNEVLKKNISSIENEFEYFKNNFHANTEVKNENNEEIKHPTVDLPTDMQEVVNENTLLKVELEEYKKILNEELEFRKDILKLIEELKKLK